MVCAILAKFYELVGVNNAMDAIQLMKGYTKKVEEHTATSKV
jgi:hypothetical protein